MLSLTPWLGPAHGQLSELFPLIKQILLAITFRYFLHARCKASETLGFPLDAMLESDGIMLSTLEQNIKVGERGAERVCVLGCVPACAR